MELGGTGGRLQEDLWDQRSAHRLVALRLDQMSVRTAMDEDKDVIIVNLIRPEQSGDVCQVRRSLRLARGLGTGRAFFPSLPTGISHVPSALSFFFSFETERRGPKDPLTRDPSGLLVSWDS